MEGTIKELKEVKHGVLILYDDIDTTKGQSGSAIYLKRGDSWKIIGVHVGYDESINCNIGTAITIKRYVQFMQEIAEYLEK